MSDAKDELEKALLLLGAIIGQQIEKHRRDRWKRKVKDALWPIL
jgi:hypothetical protein